MMTDVAVVDIAVGHHSRKLIHQFAPTTNSPCYMKHTQEKNTKKNIATAEKHITILAEFCFAS